MFGTWWCTTLELDSSSNGNDHLKNELWKRSLKCGMKVSFSGKLEMSNKDDQNLTFFQLSIHWKSYLPAHKKQGRVQICRWFCLRTSSRPPAKSARWYCPLWNSAEICFREETALSSVNGGFSIGNRNFDGMIVAIVLVKCSEVSCVKTRLARNARMSYAQREPEWRERRVSGEEWKE